MQTLVNPWTPQTPIGAGLQNIATAFFASNQAKQRQQVDPALQEQRYQQAELTRLKQEEVQGKLDAARRAQEAQANAPRQIAEQFFGGPDRAEEYLRYNRGEMVLPQFAMARGEEDAPIPLEPMARPEFVTPQMDARYRQTQIAPALLAQVGGPNQAAALAKVLELLYRQDMADGVVSGTVDPTKAAQGGFAAGLNQQSPFAATGNVGTMDRVTGTQTLNPIGTTEIAKNIADTGLRQAQTVTEGERPALVQAQAGSATRANRGGGRGGGSTKAPVELIPTEIGGRIVMLTPAQYATHTRATDPKPTKGPADFSPPAAVVKGMADRINAQASGIDSDLSGEVLARAIDLLRAQGTPTYRNEVAAVRQAMTEMVGTESSWFGLSERPVRKGPARTVADTGRAPALPQVAAPAAPGQSVNIPRAAAPSGVPALPPGFRMDR